jgi:hypothetical protein
VNLLAKIVQICEGIDADDGDVASSAFGRQFCILAEPLAQECLSDDCFVGDDSQLGRAVPRAQNAVIVRYRDSQSSFRARGKGRVGLPRGDASERVVVPWLI